MTLDEIKKFKFEGTIRSKTHHVTVDQYNNGKDTLFEVDLSRGMFRKVVDHQKPGQWTKLEELDNKEQGNGIPSKADQ